MRKILFLAEEMAMNGACKSLLALLEALEGQGYDINLFVSFHCGCLHSDIPKYVNVLPESLPYRIVRMPLKRALLCALQRGRVDLAIMRLAVSFTRYFKLPFPCWFMLPQIKGDYDLVCAYADGFVAQMAVRKVPTGKKALWIHCDYTKYKQSRETFDAFREADFAVSVSQDSIEKFKEAAGCDIGVPFKVVHNIIDVDDVRRRAIAYSVPPVVGGGVRIVSVGRISFEKGFDLIAEIARIVSVGRITWQKGFDLIPSIAKDISSQQVLFEWDVIGGASVEVMEQHRRLVRQSGVDGFVKFLGEMENPMPYVASADIVVIPSRFEGWGMTLSEALVLGKPVVATDIPVFREQVTNGINGILVSLEPHAFAEAIIRLIGNPTLRNQISKAAVEYPFTIDTVRKEFAELI